jgi:GNAT superfamily N-acetyltransferase
LQQVLISMTDTTNQSKRPSFMPSAMYNYVRARQLEGTYPGDHATGCWIISSLRVSRGWGNPSEEEWPYDGLGTNWPPAEPPNIDKAAKLHRICAYQRVRSLNECKIALAHQRPVNVVLSIRIADWRSASGGQIVMPSGNSTPTDSHTVFICGYNDAKANLTFQNTRGVEWGDRGYGYIPQRYFERFQLEAWTIPQDGFILPSFDGFGFLCRAWGLPDCFSETPLVGIELYDGSNDESVGWAFLVKRHGYADIEELFVKPAYRGRRNGVALAELIKTRPEFGDRPLRLWVSHADREAISSTPFRKIVRRLGLSVKPASRRWAPYVGM